MSASRRNKKKREVDKHSSDKVHNSINKHEVLVSDSDNYEEDVKKDLTEEFFQLSKKQEQLEDCTLEIDEKTCKNKNAWYKKRKKKNV